MASPVGSAFGPAQPKAVWETVSVNEMKCHLSALRAPRADGGQWGWLPGRGDTELASDAQVGRWGREGRCQCFGLEAVITWGQFVG